MDYLELENKCRICLEEGLSVDWNESLQDDEHLTYKDCYYKYTQLDCFDNICPSTMLCSNCSNSLKNINSFITAALKTHKFLQECFALNIESKENLNFETVLVSELDIGVEIHNESLHESDSKENQNEECYSLSITDNEIPIKYETTFETSHIETVEGECKTSADELQSDKAIPGKIRKYKHKKVPTRCPICSKVLQSKHSAKYHEKTHAKNRERIATCTQCGMKFFDNTTLRTHMQTHIENREKIHKCEDCDKSFYSRGTLNIHRRIHLGQAIKCTLCEKEFVRQADVDRHMRSHKATRIGDELTPKKEGDSKEFPSHNNEDTTTSIKRSRRKKQLKTVEGKCETSADELQSDKAIPGKIKKYQNKKVPTCCSICPKVLQSRYSAKLHEKTHSKNRERNVPCKQCGMKFFQSDALRSHMQTHIENREKTHKCEECDKSFYNSATLKIHRRIHSGQTAKCTICGKEFARQAHVDRHMRSHKATRIGDELTPEKKYFVECEICKQPVNSQRYKEHSAKHMNVPLVKCSLCNKEFFARQNCITHLRVVHKKGPGEGSQFAIGYKTTRYSHLFLQQNVGTVFTKE